MWQSTLRWMTIIQMNRLTAAVNLLTLDEEHYSSLNLGQVQSNMDHGIQQHSSPYQARHRHSESYRQDSQQHASQPSNPQGYKQPSQGQQPKIKLEDRQQVDVPHHKVDQRSSTPYASPRQDPNSNTTEPC